MVLDSQRVTDVDLESLTLFDLGDLFKACELGFSSLEQNARFAQKFAKLL